MYCCPQRHKLVFDLEPEPCTTVMAGVPTSSLGAVGGKKGSTLGHQNEMDTLQRLQLAGLNGSACSTQGLNLRSQGGGYF